MEEAATQSEQNWGQECLPPSASSPSLLQLGVSVDNLIPISGCGRETYYCLCINDSGTQN